MNIEVIEQEENPLLHRTDVTFRVTHEDATPSRLSVRDSLAATLNRDSAEVVVHELDTKFGMRKTIGYAKVYESAADAAEVEQKYMLDRNKISSDAGESEAEATE
jgi:small subunit ribosomal protein S24e